MEHGQWREGKRSARLGAAFIGFPFGIGVRAKTEEKPEKKARRKQESEGIDGLEEKKGEKGMQRMRTTHGRASVCRVLEVSQSGRSAYARARVCVWKRAVGGGEHRVRRKRSILPANTRNGRRRGGPGGWIASDKSNSAK